MDLQLFQNLLFDSSEH